MKSYLFRLCFIFFVCILAGCSTLSPFRVYTSSSGRGIVAFQQLDYSFVYHCEGNCRDLDLAENRINRLPCNCDDSKKADSVNVLIYQAIYNYIISLDQFSGSTLTAYPVKQLGSSVISTKIINVTDQQVDAFNTLSDLISKAVTYNYRKDKLKSYVVSAQVPFKTLISALQFNMEMNLSGTIDVRKQRIRSTYYELLNHKQNSAYEKRKITEDYYQLIERLDAHKAALRYFSEILAEIKDGHQQIYNNLDQLNNTELQTALASHAATIDVLISKIVKK